MRAGSPPKLRALRLRDLLHAEGQLVKALPKMAEVANSEALRLAFETHLDQTKEQVERLKEIFSSLEVLSCAFSRMGIFGMAATSKAGSLAHGLL